MRLSFEFCVRNWIITNQISKVGFKDQLWIDSNDFSLEIELISHQK